MKFTFDWLKSHLKTDLSYVEISEKLTDLGIEVEEITDNSKKFENFVVGFIESAEKHPNADKLQVCKVNIGKEKLQIVCGAKNARKGLYVAVAKVGALVPAFNEKLKKSMIRGLESQGMMCSTDELLIQDDGIDGILELENSPIPGQDLASALNLNEIIFDVSLTPNRADCFSVRGIARDLAAIDAGGLLDLDNCDIYENIENPIDVEIQTKNCDYFSTLVVKNVMGKTPDYIARRLTAIGQNLINLPVDVANYVCIDIGQPLHIFDLDKLPKKIYVRESRQGEILETLNNKITTLPSEAIVVSTENEPLSIAGIMGGKPSSFDKNSKNILIEGAYFNKVSIAKTGQNLRLCSDSRTRFERGVDPQNIELAVKYTASILSKCCNCQISNIKKHGKLPENKYTIALTFKKFQALTNLTNEDFKNSLPLLEKLGIKIKSANNEKIIVETPTWRHDLEIEEDLIEEIVRLMGYDHISEMELEKKEPITQRYLTDKLSDALLYNGYYEVKTFSFIDLKTAELFAEKENLIEIQDALTNEFAFLRPSVIASHLKSIKNSQNKSQHNLKLFEIGKQFIKNNNEITESSVLTATISEKFTERNWKERQNNVSIFDIKILLEKLINLSNINTRLISIAPKYYHPGRSGTYIFQKDTPLAYFGEVHPTILSSLGITGPIVCFELFLNNLPDILIQKIKNPLIMSQYQATTRDFSFIIKKSTSANDILNTIKKLKIIEIKDIKIFDVYESSSIGNDNKAIAFELLLQSDKSTLSEDQINDISQKVIKSINETCDGILRDQ